MVVSVCCILCAPVMRVLHGHQINLGIIVVLHWNFVIVGQPCQSAPQRAQESVVGCNLAALVPFMTNKIMTGCGEAKFDMVKYDTRVIPIRNEAPFLN